MYNSSPHKFHIPVMGLAYTIDTPVKVARYGISSAISIVEDRLVEMMRRHYYNTLGQEYRPITTHDEDYRARRITDYLNLVNRIVQEQFEQLKCAAFEAGSEIVKYFEMLPENSRLKQLYLQMMGMVNGPEKNKMESYLRANIKPGSIDVNILTKTDRDNHDKLGKPLADGSDAVAALRGFAKSGLVGSSVIFSAGMNPRLFNYLGNCPEFDVNGDGGFTKKVIIKVSDYRSALVQGKYLAKKGIWVSEFRVESGLNCGGHAFATDGFLMGPILEEFRSRKQELIDTLFEIYNAALLKKSGRKFVYHPVMVFSAQGGIGTHEEDVFLHRHYNMHSTGWGTPFLLVPEATTVDADTLQLLCVARENDVVLSNNSPLGVRFHYLKGTSADTEKSSRIHNGRPGSPCTEKHLAFNTEFTKEPICTASQKYQKLKIARLQEMGLSAPEYGRQLNAVLEKECLCVGLSNAAAACYDETFIKTLKAVNICPGPNIANFSEVVSLQSMTDHIYGRKRIPVKEGRPNMFIRELQLYLHYLEEQLMENEVSRSDAKKKKYITSFNENLLEGIRYYRNLPGISAENHESFIRALDLAEIMLEELNTRFGIRLQQVGSGSQ